MKFKNQDFFIGDISNLQRAIMLYIDHWAHIEKTPIPYKLVIETMQKGGIKKQTTIKALKGLLEKKYIRRAITTSNKTYYVQLRRV